MSAPDRGASYDRDHEALSIRRQCGLLGVARSAAYRPPALPSEEDFALMRRLDELYMAWPFVGLRRTTALLRGAGHVINRQAGAAADAGHGHRGAGAEAGDNQAGAGEQESCPESSAKWSWPLVFWRGGRGVLCHASVRPAGRR